MSGTNGPVYAPADEQRARADNAAWAHFVSSGNDAEFCSAWLALLSGRIETAHASLLLIAEAEDLPFAVVAAWPDPQRDLQYLGPVAQRALAERGGVVMAPDGTLADDTRAAHVGYPIEVAGRLIGVVVFDVGARVPGGLQSVLRQIHWASAWLYDHYGRQRLTACEAELSRVTLLDDLMATTLQHRQLRASALAVANELTIHLRCDRVSIGIDNRAQIELIAMSHAATFDRRSNLVRAISDAMDEVLDLGVAVVLPSSTDDELDAIAHAESARTLQLQALMSVPLIHDSETLGVITFERSLGPPFDSDDQRLARVLGTMLGPVWALLHDHGRPWWRRAGDAARALLVAALGPRAPGLKLAAMVGTLLLLGVAMFHADYRVAARTVIEGSTQLSIVAPFEGFIAEALVRAGDTVRVGQALARLDERDLGLDRTRWQAELEQLRRKHQVAMAAADLSAMGVIGAQVRQSEAQLALAQEKLTRATLVAPFDGVVVSGDLSQKLGIPIESGKLLFEVAPLNGYRVILQVDDRDIAHVALAQSGELVLSSQPDHAFPFTVSAVTPVATQTDGRNVFRVEAIIKGQVVRLRPGMEGIGKIVVGERTLLWIWTHRFVDWLRLAFWNWMP